MEENGRSIGAKAGAGGAEQAVRSSAGRPPGGVEFKKRRKLKGMYEVLYSVTEEGRTKRVRKRTGCYDRQAAEDWYRLHDAERRGLLPSREVTQVRLGTLIGAALADGTVPRSRAERLTEHFGGLRLYAIDHDACEDYVVSWLEKRRALAQGTVSDDLGALRKIVNAHCAEHHITAPTVYLIVFGAGRQRWLRKSEVDRLIGTADGRIWDAGGWRRSGTRPGAAPLLRSKEVRARWKPIARLLRLAIYTGSRVGSIRAAQWGLRTDAPYIDLPNGMFWRCGSEQAPERKRQPEVPIEKRFLEQVRAWAEEDAARGCTHVIADADGVPLDRFNYAGLVAEVVRAAGLDASVTAHVVRHSSAVWLLEGGLTPEETASFLGIEVQTLLGWYDHYHQDFSQLAADALDSASF